MLKFIVLASILGLGAAAQSINGILGSLPSSFPAACQSQCAYVKAIGTTCKDLDGSGSCTNDVCDNTDKFKTCLDCAKESDKYDSILTVCAYLDNTGVYDSPVADSGPSPSLTGEYTLDLSETGTNSPLPPVAATPKAGDDRAAAASSAPASGPSPSLTGEYTLDLSETGSNSPLPVVATPKAGDDRAAASSSAPVSGDKSGAGAIMASVGAVAAGAVVAACF